MLPIQQGATLMFLIHHNTDCHSMCFYSDNTFEQKKETKTKCRSVYSADTENSKIIMQKFLNKPQLLAACEQIALIF